MTTHSVIMYSTPSCSWCRVAKDYLRRRNISYREVDVQRDPKAAQELVRRTGQTSVPVIQIDGRLVQGFNQAEIDRLLGLKPGTSH
jgi:glutaredoxin 3